MIGRKATVNDGFVDLFDGENATVGFAFEEALEAVECRAFTHFLIRMIWD
ncbi:hypothetical protein [Agrobacterium vitis]|nr:hypothetical protein [Agrobacterium vitis]NSZ17352.1 hypothetical protein [Agrobacterium vitis]QZO03060.1 hypothetical protein K4831_11450 [Agrobacterium vitis]UJL88181.1 hypothetical protein AVF2S5_09790 [Agrobacterium vitis]